MTRASWDATWMATARAVSGRSDCVRAKVGAVVVDATNRVVATGFNGAPAPSPRTCQADCPRALGDGDTAGYTDCISIHAEANALLFGDRSTRVGGTIYVTTAPCNDCAKLIANSGLVRVVVEAHDADLVRRHWTASRDVLADAKITTVVHPVDQL